MTSTEPTTQQRREAVDIGMRMAEKFQKLHGRPLPKDYIEFAGMLAVAFNLGREHRENEDARVHPDRSTDRERPDSGDPGARLRGDGEVDR